MFDLTPWPTIFVKGIDFTIAICLSDLSYTSKHDTSTHCVYTSACSKVPGLYEFAFYFMYSIRTSIYNWLGNEKQSKILHIKALDKHLLFTQFTFPYGVGMGTIHKHQQLHLSSIVQQSLIKLNSWLLFLLGLWVVVFFKLCCTRIYIFSLSG